MFRTLMAAIGVCGLLLLLQPRGIEAGTLIINGFSSMTINSGSTLTMNCADITVNSGATFINNGTVATLGELIKESGSTSTDGTLETCSGSSGKSWFVIPAANGKTIIFAL